jgi:hypothetical protein
VDLLQSFRSAEIPSLLLKLVYTDRPLGIHGQPPENWNGIQKPNGKPGSYCTHGELVFPTWHRVYINMFEVKWPLSHFQIDKKLTEP